MDNDYGRWKAIGDWDTPKVEIGIGTGRGDERESACEYEMRDER